MADDSADGPLVAAIRTALKAQDELSEAWRQQRNEGDIPNTPANIDLLKQLIKQRIHPLNAFEHLARMDREEAIQMLITCYLLKGASPDRKFGGYVFELSTMLDDLKEFHGEAALRDLVRHSLITPTLKSDRRIAESFAEAMDISVGEVLKWFDAASPKTDK
jgi:hypothetical protein